MSFSANCISCHMCQNICFWIVHFCWEFLSEFPKHWYLLRHLFISVQFMRLGEPTLCVFLQFCTSSIVLLTSCVNTMHCVFQQCELLCICADIPWNLCTLPGWVSSIADRHQEGGKAWNQLLRFLTHHPHRILEGNRATFKSDSSSATKNLLDKAVRLLVQQVQPFLQKSDKSQIFYWSSQTALGSGSWLINGWIVNHAQKPENGPISDLFNLTQNTFCLYCLILT